MIRKRKLTALLAAAMLASLPMTAHGFEMIGEYYEISCHEAGAFIFDGTTVTEGTTGRLVLSKLESSWASKSIISTTDMTVLTAKLVQGDSGLNEIEYTAKKPGKVQLTVIVESGAAVNMGTFYVTAADPGSSSETGWIQENGVWKYKMGNGEYKRSEWFVDNGKWYYFGEDGAMYADQWVQSESWWYYLGSDGAMLVSTTTPDGYWVNDSGVWEG